MGKIIESFPGADGFRMPGEFEAHRGCWMLWPERLDNWRKGAHPAQKAYAKVAETINRFEPVSVGVTREQFSNARKMLHPEIRVVEIASNDSWIRDTGPTFVTGGSSLRAVDWKFNAYGGLHSGAYFPWDDDELIATKVAEIEGADRYMAPFILEGGAFHVDGEGTCIVVSECLLHPNRNPNLKQEEIDNFLRGYLGVEKIIWLAKGVYNDGTNGHVDNLVCFSQPGEVLLHWEEDANDPQHEISVLAFEQLKRQKDSQGRTLEIRKIPQPGPLYLQEEEVEDLAYSQYGRKKKAGERLPASYINFYLPNGGVVVPTFGVSEDDEVLKMMEGVFPDREVVGVYSREIILGGGNIHCITQQVPEEKKD